MKRRRTWLLILLALLIASAALATWLHGQRRYAGAVYYHSRTFYTLTSEVGPGAKVKTFTSMGFTVETWVDPIGQVARLQLSSPDRLAYAVITMRNWDSYEWSSAGPVMHRLGGQGNLAGLFQDVLLPTATGAGVRKLPPGTLPANFFAPPESTMWDQLYQWARDHISSRL